MRGILLSILLLAAVALAIHWFTDSPDVENRTDANLSPSDSSPRSWSLSGVVRSSNGRPLANARVQVLVKRGKIIEELEAQTNREGSYVFLLNAVTNASTLERSTMEISVLAHAPGYQFGEEFFTDEFLDFLQGTDTAMSLDLALVPATALRGRVQTHRGAAVSCVVVRAIGPSPFESYAETDENGQYTLYVHERGTFQVGLECDFERSATSVQVSLGDDVVIPTFKLPDWASISGMVVLPRGLAAPNLLVIASGGPIGSRDFEVGTSCTTDAQGRFVLHSGASGVYEVQIGGTLDPSTVAEVRGGDEGVRLVRSEATLSIRIVASDGSGFPGAELCVEGGEPASDEEARRFIAGELEEESALDNYEAFWMNSSATDEFFGKPGSVWKITAHAAHVSASKTVVLESPRTEVILRLTE